VVCCEWVLCSSVAFSAYPAVGCCVSHLLRSAFVCACVVGSVGFWVRSVPCCLAGGTPCAVGGQGTAGEAGLAYWHDAQVNGALQVGQVGWVMGAVSSGVGCS
jgi:hypothetical protein